MEINFIHFRETLDPEMKKNIKGYLILGKIYKIEYEYGNNNINNNTNNNNTDKNVSNYN